ncbi:DNA-directed RNA polymerase subunit delta [Salirhabdus euzebyi]|uniref:Probable DNA-directed RNA polymerase subunit delta n=1 Tax=Salirhabdus euzebyi TaxID=394506 RepID=A0A841Q698_9BACI|nr:DNA-directed RNA polymerase subunit delta [Salirhabdus euzebyi]MBB6453921.1 DNA-directed RNA polymerase subunit delta [Salirhabdus euzebyi]
MSLEKYTQEDLVELSMLEVAIEILLEEKKALDFKELYNLVAKAKGFTAEQKKENIASFYTDLNVDGRFMTVGSNVWGLRRWYPVDQVEEDLAPVRKKKKKAAKKEEEDFDDYDVEDDLDDLEEDLEEDDLDDDDSFDDDDDESDDDLDDDFDYDSDDDSDDDTDFDSDDDDNDLDEDFEEEEDK